MAADPHDPRPKGEVTAKLAGTWRGFPVELSLNLDVRKLDASIAYLEQQGFAPPPRPLRFDLTPSGDPICPRHNVPMREREKQGDCWHSHAVAGPDGERLYCRGYAGPDSPGYFVEPEPVPAAVPTPTPGSSSSSGQAPPPPARRMSTAPASGPGPGVRTAPATGRAFGRGIGR